MEQAAGQGHAYAMESLAGIHYKRNEMERAVEWFTKAAEAGLAKAMFNVGRCLDTGEGLAAPDFPAAADWYRRGLADISRHVIGQPINSRDEGVKRVR